MMCPNALFYFTFLGIQSRYNCKRLVGTLTYDNIDNDKNVMNTSTAASLNYFGLLKH